MKKNRFATVWIHNTRKLFKLIPNPLAHICLGLVLLGLACAVCSCSSVTAQTTKYSSVPPQPPTQAAAVRILRFQPTQPCQPLGEIVVNTPSDTPQATQQVADKLKEEAAKLGADAVVVVDARLQQEGKRLITTGIQPYMARKLSRERSSINP
jgi:hypothetical protein